MSYKEWKFAKNQENFQRLKENDEQVQSMNDFKWSSQILESITRFFSANQRFACFFKNMTLDRCGENQSAIKCCSFIFKEKFLTSKK